jgi:hypothetical protein
MSVCMGVGQVAAAMLRDYVAPEGDHALNLLHTTRQALLTATLDDSVSESLFDVAQYARPPNTHHTRTCVHAHTDSQSDRQTE